MRSSLLKMSWRGRAILRGLFGLSQLGKRKKRKLIDIRYWRPQWCRFLISFYQWICPQQQGERLCVFSRNLLTRKTKGGQKVKSYIKGDNERGFKSKVSGFKNYIRAAQRSKWKDNDRHYCLYELSSWGLMATVLMMLPLALKCNAECGTLPITRLEPLGTSPTHFLMFLIQQTVPRWS